MDRTQLCGSCDVGSIPTERTSDAQAKPCATISKIVIMKKDIFIKSAGVVQTPHPLPRPDAIDHSPDGDDQNNTPSFSNKETMLFAYSLVAKNLLKNKPPC